MMRQIPVTELYPHTFSLLATRRCPCVCRHCVYRCSPDATEAIDRETAEAYIEAAALLGRMSPSYTFRNQMPLLSFSGGDPFSDLGLLFHLIQFASTRSLVVQVCTSGFWAGSRGESRRILKELAACGLRAIRLSCDDEHAAWVHPRHVLHAIEAAISLGIRVHLSVLIHDNARITTDTIWKHFVSSEPLSAALRASPLLVVRGLPYCDVGRGEDCVELSNSCLHHYGTFGGCPNALRGPSLDWQGRLFCCCGLANYCFDRSLAYSPLCHGDLAGRSVTDFVETYHDMQHDLLSLLLHHVGPGGILEQVLKDHPSLSTRSYYSHPCEICKEMFSDPLLLDAANDSLHRIARLAYDDVLTVL